MEILPRCHDCDVLLTEQNAYSKGGKRKGFQSRCKICFNLKTTERLRANKIKAIEHKGGKCQRCGYSRSAAALEFHHRDRTEKDRNISRLMFRTWKTILTEVEKCDLLCANCHREEEDRLASVA